MAVQRLQRARASGQAEVAEQQPQAVVGQPPDTYTEEPCLVIEWQLAQRLMDPGAGLKPVLAITTVPSFAFSTFSSSLHALKALSRCRTVTFPDDPSCNLKGNEVDDTAFVFLYYLPRSLHHSALAHQLPRFWTEGLDVYCSRPEYTAWLGW